MSDQELRELERRAALEPSDARARVAYGLGLVRHGRTGEALAFLDAGSRLGYGALLAAASEPGAGLLLDAAPEWRGSGGDAGLSRWSVGEPVRSPRLGWRRRLDGVHACLGVAVDRGRAFALVLAPGGRPELLAFSVATGATLWRATLGSGPAAAPCARGGRVFAAYLHREGGSEVLRTVSLDGATGLRRWESEERDLEVPAPGRLVPGALGLLGSTLVLPVAASARGASSLAEVSRRSAFVRAADDGTGAVRWLLRRQQVGSEVALLGEHAFIAVDQSRGEARVLRLGLERGDEQGDIRGDAGLLAAAGTGLAFAGRGVLSVRDLETGAERGSSQGGAETSLAFDGARVLLGRGRNFVVRDAASWEVRATWETGESPIPYAPRGVAQAPPAPRSAVVARDLAYLASPLAPTVSAWSVATGEPAWRLEVEGLLPPEDGPRLTWPILEVPPVDRGPLFLAPLPGRVLGVTLSGYVFLVEEA